MGTEVLVAEMAHQSISRSGAAEQREDQTDRLLHLLVRVEHDLVFIVVHEADWQQWA